LATDPKLMNKTGQVLTVADLRDEYGFVDVALEG
jgi:hypothetical protein